MPRLTKPVTFAARLAERRRAAGLSQTELALRTGVSRQTVCNLEAGRFVATWPTVQALARALGVSTEELRDK